MTASRAPAATADAAPDPALSVGARRPLGAYTDAAGRAREIVTRPGADASVLVIDEDAATLGDRRLVAHLSADEPAENAALVARLYLADPAGRFARPVSVEDLTGAPGARRGDGMLLDARGGAYRLSLRPGAWGGGELRWTVTGPDGAPTRIVGLRDVVGALESYQPACAMTEQAVRLPPDPLVSTLALVGELERLRRSTTVLNRALREAVQAAVAEGQSLSQIAARCGRAKSPRTKPNVGDTSWLARRIGLMPEAGREAPSPWIHTELLAVIARDGLGLDPRQVEPA
jgi:hypothetical protein